MVALGQITFALGQIVVALGQMTFTLGQIAVAFGQMAFAVVQLVAVGRKIVSADVLSFNSALPKLE